MKNDIEKLSSDTFESIKQIDENGSEYWYARALAKVLDYSDYRNFIKVIEKAKIACQLSNNNTLYHFVEVTDMVQIGSGATRQMSSYALSRYACYLIVQNADASKPVIANGQTYLAIQTRKQEILEQGRELEKRLEIRSKLRATETELSATIYKYHKDTSKPRLVLSQKIGKNDGKFK